MRSYPSFIDNDKIHSTGDSLIDTLETVVSQIGFEILTSVTIMAGSFGTISILAAVFHQGIIGTVRGLLSALAGI